MRTQWLLLVLFSGSALAARPGGDRHERLTSSSSRQSALYWSLDAGASVWNSPSVSAVSGDVRASFGTHLVGRDLRLGGELDFGVTQVPPSDPKLWARLGLSVSLGWNVVATLAPSATFELGPELAVGACMTSQGDIAAPAFQAGLFAGYRISPNVTLGVRVRGLLFYWLVPPRSFHGGKFVDDGWEPSGGSAHVSLIRTF